MRAIKYGCCLSSHRPKSSMLLRILSSKTTSKGVVFACLQIVAYNIPSDDRRMLSYIMVRGGDARMIVDLSTRLRQLRQDKHLRQEQVAILVGVSKGAISAYENDIRQPSYDVLIRLANLYRVTTDYLLGRTDDRTIDVSGLTAQEIALVSDLVASMTAKNQKLEEFR